MAVDKPVPPDRVPVDKAAPTASDTGASDKTATSATTEKSSADKKNARIVAATAESTPTAKAPRAVVARTTTPARGTRAGATSEWWVQVGAFRDENTAKNLAAKLREQNYMVARSRIGGGARKSATLDKSAPAASTSNPAGADQYDVFVSGLSADELNTRVAGKGLSAEPSGTGVVLKPSLPLRDAVALSKDLATDGYKVQVRRASATGASAPRTADKRPVPAASSGDTLYRVRVGAFSDRATAMSTLRELEAKGYKPFIARGGS
jgi:cell division septation protein DedD